MNWRNLAIVIVVAIAWSAVIMGALAPTIWRAAIHFGGAILLGAALTKPFPIMRPRSQKPERAA